MSSIRDTARSGGSSRFYAGIGSRKTPANVQMSMTEMAEELAEEGWYLRSGHAEGADQAFEKGANGRAEIFLPWQTFNSDVPVLGRSFSSPTNTAWELARKSHPAWDRLSRAARLLHARNCHQILGLTLDDPVKIVICWTPRGAEVGGTAQALRIAKTLDIPIINLATAEDQLIENLLRRGEIR